MRMFLASNNFKILVDVVPYMIHDVTNRNGYNLNPKLVHVRPVTYEKIYASLREKLWRKIASAVCSFIEALDKTVLYYPERIYILKDSRSIKGICIRNVLNKIARASDAIIYILQYLCWSYIPCKLKGM